MAKILSVVFCCIALSGCAGTASYSVAPFYEPHLNQMVCCAATAKSSKDVGSLSFNLSTNSNGVITVVFSETGVSASKPIAAQSGAITSISNAVSNTAAAVVRLTP